MKPIVACLVLVLPLLTAEARGAAAPRPNVIIIMADDMGYSDIGCYGGEISTPNLDALAKGGMRFTHFYNTARCCPTRASLLTGLYAHQAGVGHMVQDKGHPSYQGFLNDKCVTVAEALRPAGYATLMVGKWHVGEKIGPDKRGFDRSYSLVSGGSNYFKLDKNRTFAEDGREFDPMKDGWYTTEAFSDKAVQYVSEYAGKEKPFFLYLAYTAPHWPLQALPADIAKYKGRYALGWDELRKQRHARMLELGVIPPGTELSPRAPRAPAWDSLAPAKKADFERRMEVYAAQIECMDRGIGRVVAKLRELNQLDNTLILFLADNGGCAEEINRPEDPKAEIGAVGSFNSYGLPWANASNTPFRTFKHWVHEGGIASPLIAHWPARVKPGTITQEVGHVIDLAPTTLDLAGAAYPREFNGKPITPVEGVTLLPALEGGRLKDRPVFWEHEGNRAVRVGNWKLVARHNQPWELYDVAKDRSELTDLATENAGKTKELAALWDEWARRAGVVEWRVLNRQAGGN